MLISILRRTIYDRIGEVFGYGPYGRGGMSVKEENNLKERIKIFLIAAAFILIVVGCIFILLVSLIASFFSESLRQGIGGYFYTVVMRLIGFLLAAAAISFLTYRIFAKISEKRNLPHTKVVMKLEFLEGVNQEGVKIARISPDRGDSWEDMEIQISQEVYRLPEDLSRFQEEGWDIEEQGEYSTHLINNGLKGHKFCAVPVFGSFCLACLEDFCFFDLPADFILFFWRAEDYRRLLVFPVTVQSFPAPVRPCIYMENHRRTL